MKVDQQLLRELQGDLAHLRRKSENLIDKLYLTQDRIQKVKWRLEKVGTYPLPDGRTK